MLALAEHRSFSEAAQALNITQSALSRSIQSLEDTLGTKLFERTTRHVSLTTAGQLGLAAATQILSSAAEFHRSVSPAGLFLRRDFCIGIGTAMAAVFGSLLLRNFLPDHPHLRLVLKVDAPETLYEHLILEDVDVVIGTADTTPNCPYFVTTQVDHFGRGFFTSANHPLAGKVGLELSDVLEFTMAASLPMPERIVKTIEQLYCHPFEDLFKIRSNHHESLINLVLNSTSVVFGVNVPYLNYLRCGSIVQLDVRPAFPDDMAITITHLTGRPPPSGAGALAGMLRAWTA